MVARVNAQAKALVGQVEAQTSQVWEEPQVMLEGLADCRSSQQKLECQKTVE